MELRKQEHEGDEGEEFIPDLVKHSFRTFCLTLLSLLLPLSFIVLARSPSVDPIFTAPFFPLLQKPVFNFLLCFLCFAAALHSLTGHLPKPPAAVAWALLLLLQLCVVSGVESSIAAAAGRSPRASVLICGPVTWLLRAALCAGLWRAMKSWARMVVGPVVDDAVSGVGGAQREELVAGAVAFAVMWVWLLQDEVEPMVHDAVRRGLGRGVGWDGTVAWLVSHVTLVIGFFSVVDGAVACAKKIMLCYKERDENEDEDQEEDCCILLLNAKVFELNPLPLQNASLLSCRAKTFLL